LASVEPSSEFVPLSSPSVDDLEHPRNFQAENKDQDMVVHHGEGRVKISRGAKTFFLHKKKPKRIFIEVKKNCS
jgi:hypothetical protein